MVVFYPKNAATRFILKSTPEPLPCGLVIRNGIEKFRLSFWKENDVH